jgi:hypothetical protein
MDRDKVAKLERQLNDFDRDTRAEALDALLALVEQGEIEPAPMAEVANMHCHTFFSYNGYGYSPTALAWLARKQGYKLMGIVDFDVLDGVREFLVACDAVGVRGTAGMETRVYLPEFADREINSPGEPGIFYYMGIGFTDSVVPPAAPEARVVLDGMRRRAERRNREMIDRVNAHLDPVGVDYRRDVLPLTPADNATERHMCVAYVRAAAAIVHDPVAFWADKLDVPPERVAAVIDDGPQIQSLVRAKLMKRGGVGYVQPGPDTFPTVEEVNKVIAACAALPCATWLDGTSEGEQAEEELLSMLIDKGVVALNIVPDRNWNIDDPAVKRDKLQNLYDVVELAQRLDLVLNVGTEMNAYGKKHIDDFAAPELAPVRDAFLAGAYTVYGHTALQRALGLGYTSAWACSHVPDRGERNAFYAKVGRRVPAGVAELAQVRALGPDVTPVDVLRCLETD